MTDADDLTLDELRARLADAKHDYDLAKYIDSYPRMKRERLRFAEEIRRLQSAIRAREASEGEQP